MNFAKKAAMYLGFVVIAAILIWVLAPRATHALVATLVQVSNTTASPVPTADVHGSAAQILELYCYTDGGGVGETVCEQVFPIIPLPPPFTVPAGQNFVITEIEAACSGGATEFLDLNYPISNVGGSVGYSTRRFEFPCNSTTVEFNLQPGIVIPSTGVAIASGVSKGTDFPTYVRGYLTAN